MNPNQLQDRLDHRVRTVSWSDEFEIVVDLGPSTDASVDVVEETVIIVTDADQHEIDLDTTPKQVFMKNGVLTIKQEA